MLKIHKKPKKIYESEVSIVKSKKKIKKIVLRKKESCDMKKEAIL